MKKKAYFNIKVNDTELVEKLERDGMEVTAYTDNLNFLLSNHPELDTAVDKYTQKKINAEQNYEKDKKELSNTYIPEYLREKHSWSWSLDFATEIMTICVDCECGIQELKKHGVAYREE